MKATNPNLKRISGAICFLLSCLLLLCACSKDNDSPNGWREVEEYRIAIVLPKKGAYWKETIRWSLENLNRALTEVRNIKVTAEWHDENEENLEELFKTLAEREDIHAIIGPLYSKNAQIAARHCLPTSKTLIPATITSESIMRQYSKKGFLWCLTENDISQCEILLVRALQQGAESVSLLAGEDDYGRTFRDWFAFQAFEMGLTVHSVVTYTDATLQECMHRLLREDTDYLICVPSTQEIAEKMNVYRKDRTGLRPRLLYSDVAFICPKDKTFEGMEGITLIHDPESGFHTAYKVRFGEEPSYGSAHFFDAITLTGLAILDADLYNSTDINASLRRIVDGTGEAINSIQETNIRRAVRSILSGTYPHIEGASGKLYFDNSIYTNVIHSVYCQWQVYQGQQQILGYNTSDDSKRTNSSAANWNWKATKMQSFDRDIQIQYPPQEDLYALIIAAASGWENYRHQADAYAFYQLLKERGVKDDHILLVSEDDIAGNPRNPTPGIIQSALDNSNLRQGIEVDYHPSETNLDKLADLLSGRTETMNPHPGPNDNLLVYWAGHGEARGPYWLDKTISNQQVADFFQELSDRQCFRKLLFIMESCYAGQVGRHCELQNIDGMLTITATNEDEMSKASVTDATGQIWLTNSFTNAVLRQLAKATGKNQLSLYDFYHTTYNLTLGSHVSVYNTNRFGNLYTSVINEFIEPR